MILDYVPQTRAFTLRLPRTESGKVQSLIREHGFDFSLKASTPREALLFTREPYAAASFGQYATDAARAEIADTLREVDASWARESGAHIKCPMDRELWPFQKAGVEYALRRNNTLIGDQPGLGKTEQAICVANEIGAKRVLVICPAAVRRNVWLKRIPMWTTMPWPYHIYVIEHGHHGVSPVAQWTIVSYDLARTEAIGRAISKGKYDLIIMDEIHYCKTIDTSRTQAIFGDHTGMYRRAIKDEHDKIVDYEELFRPISKSCGMMLGLSGTIMPNRPAEAYVVAHNFCPDAIDWISERAFMERYNPRARIEGFKKDGTPYVYTREEVGRASELQNRMRANFMVRRLKRDVMPQLDLPIYDVIQVEETKAVKMALEAESLLGIDVDALETGDITTLGIWAIVRQQLGLAMAPQVADYAAMLIDGGEEKLVIFAWHIAVLDILQERLRKFGVLRVDGSTSAKQKELRVDLFCKDPKFKVLIGNTLSLGTGTDGLQHVCAHALIAEPDPVPGNNEQAVDRLDRGGQKRTVQADLFVAPKSLLEKIFTSALRKRHNTHKALDQRQ
jgi:hypothetical protein